MALPRVKATRMATKMAMAMLIPWVRVLWVCTRSEAWMLAFISCWLWAVIPSSLFWMLRMSWLACLLCSRMACCCFIRARYWESTPSLPVVSRTKPWT